MTKTSDIFYVAKSPDKVICPPDQVFRIRNFEFLLTAGGHLVEDDLQYDELMKLLIDIGESSFTVKENIGATRTDKSKAFEAKFSVNSNLKKFDNKISEFDGDFGMMTFHWFVHGQSKDWGIYIAEYPTIKIIGCTSELVEKFRRVFRIEEYGYEQEKELLHRELQLLKDPNDRNKFFENYKIKTHHNST
jgi:hypothetical protein